MVQEQLEEIRQNIRNACERSGRKVEDVTLIAVSKTKPVPMLQEAYDAGARDFGENKVQEILEKEPQLPSDRQRAMAEAQTLIADSPSGTEDAYKIYCESFLGEEHRKQIEKEAVKRDLDVSILLEVNVAGEESKFGFAPEEVEEAAREIAKYPHVHIQGLMTIAPFVENSEENRGVFKKLYEFAVDIGKKNIDNVTMDVLSMGMTGDYQVAVEEGSTMIRVGTGIFGAR